MTDKKDQALSRTYFNLCEETARGILKPLYVVCIERY